MNQHIFNLSNIKNKNKRNQVFDIEYYNQKGWLACYNNSLLPIYIDRTETLYVQTPLNENK